MTKNNSEQTRLIATELIKSGKTLDEANLPTELAEAVRALILRIFSINNPKNLQNLVDDYKDGKTIDVTELIRELELESQYNKRLDTLKYFGFLDEVGETKKGDAKLPSLNEVISSFKPEELKIASRFQRPTLILVPGTDFDTIVKAIDFHKIKDQQDTYVDEKIVKTNSESNIIGWHSYIVDGAPKMELYEGDIDILSCVCRVEIYHYNIFHIEPMIHGMDSGQYTMLMIEGMKNGNPIDRETFTFLDNNVITTDHYVDLAHWNNGVRFIRLQPNFCLHSARFRKSVGGL